MPRRQHARIRSSPRRASSFAPAESHSRNPQREHEGTRMTIDKSTDIVAMLGDVFAQHGPAAAAAAKTYSPGDFSVHFFLQLAVILLACRIAGWFGRKFLAQPQVVGEMIAGVFLGPSLLGMLFPDLQAAIFPKETRNVLYAGSQLGVGLYMFLVGTTLQLDHFKTKAKRAVGVS